MRTLRLLTLSFSLLILSQQAFALFEPETAISLALSEKLKYVGTYIPTWSASGTMPSCIYKNSKVFVLSNYCQSRDIPAASIRIHSTDDKIGHVDIYAEGLVAGDISEMNRADYFEPLWRLSSDPEEGGFHFNMTAKEYRAYEQVESERPLSGCMTNDYVPDSYCEKDYESSLATWGAKSIEFRKSPSQNWYLLLKTLKKLVPAGQ